MSFAEQLSYLMKKHGTKDSELARFVGVSRQAVMGWKNGSSPAYDKVEKIAKYYDLPIDYFFKTVKQETQQDDIKKILELLNKKRVPVVGSIRAGYPVESFETVGEYVSLPDGVKYSDSLFALTVAGDSMMPLVMEGDIIICDKNTEQANGKICAVTIDGESTLKRVKIDANSVTLIPTNPMYKEIKLSSKKAEEKNFRIDGVLVQMIRNFM